MMMMMLSRKYGLLHAWIVIWCTNHCVIEAIMYDDDERKLCTDFPKLQLAGQVL